MKLETTHEKIKTALNKLNKIPSKQMQLPALSCILFEAKSGSLKLRATNLEVGAEINIPVKVEKEGEVLVPEHVLLPYIMNLSPRDQKIVFDQSSNNLKISSQGRNATIKALPNEDFPAIPRVKSDNKIKISIAEFILGLRSVLYSVSTVSTKPELGSVLFEAGEDGLVFAATDAFRLAEKKIKIRNTDAGMSCRVLIPYKNVIDLIRVFEGADADVLVVVGEHQMAVDGNDLYFTTRLVDAVFPDYPKLFPKESKSEVTVLRHDLIQAMKTAQIFSDKVSQVVVSVLREQERFEISSKNTDLGDQSELVDAVIEGEDITLSLNWRHILDCLNNISTDSVNMRFHGLGKPIVMRGVGDPSFAYLAMPLNVT